jgi:transporter family protein
MALIGSGWVVWALLAAVFAALTAIFAKIGLEDVDPDLATLVRTAVILVVLAPFVWLSGKWSNPLSLSSRTLLFLVLSALATGASWIFYYRALQVGPASMVAPIDKLSVVLVGVFAFALLGERPSAQQWIGLALVAGGVLLISLQRSPTGT